MPFGQLVTSFIANFIPNDPVAPQVTADFVQTLPPNPIKGEAVSTFVQELIPNDPVHPTDLGSDLSEFIEVVQGPDLGDGFLL